LAKSARFDAIICLGAIIRGATPHFEYISAEVSKGIASVGLETGVPVIFGVLTTDTIEQAIERAGTKSGNKGADAAMTAIEIVDLFKKINPAVWNSLAPAGGGMPCNLREIALLWEPLAPAGEGSTA